MKTLLFILSTVSAFGQTYYVNTNNNAIATSYPTWFQVSNIVVSGGGLRQAADYLGWRQIEQWQTISNGWSVDAWVASTATNAYPKATMLIATQHNIAAAQAAAQAAANAAMTNAWTPSFVSNCQTFRATLRAFGTTETNAVVNSDTMSTWLAGYSKTNTITPQLTAQFIFMGQMYPQLLQWAETTAKFPWRFIP